ncbi:substrate-binding periplasmic protein [Kordiimonas lacus]|uniref:ABC-type amino acid transport substrate-binding protein n=1 Tax=Kordiimonas lacus TaxID=637679 RepID=A0A1G6U6N9_9PROT|nr:transporter substrate-binding domain-containing protein [Kordiimonas lacus]SDD36257.1 ABC-type amino acid transport substrate-binding protein [Kordiimonas lacus]
MPYLGVTFRLCIFCFLFAFAVLTENSLAQDRVRTGHSSASVFNDVWQAILKEADIQPEFVITTDDEKRRLFIEGALELDCCTIPEWRNRPEERAVQLYTSHFFYSALHIVHRPDLPIVYRAPEDLGAYRVSVVRGHDYVHGEFFGSTVLAGSIDEAFQMVADGYADMAIANKQELMFRKKGQSLPLVLGPELHTLAMRARVHKSRPDLLDRLNDAIARMKERGDINIAIGAAIRLGNKGVPFALVGDADTLALRSVWRLVLAESGIPHRIVEMPGARKRRMFVEGGVVLDCCVVPDWRNNPDEIQVQLFSDVLYESVERYVFHEKTPLNISEATDLANFNVAVVRGFDPPLAYRSIIPGRNIGDVLNLVASGRAQVAMINIHDFRMQMETKHRPLVLGPVSEIAPLRVRVHRSRQELIPIINAAIARLRETGTITLMLDGLPR